VVYHNKWASTRGWVRLSAAYPVRSGEGEERVLVQKTLGQGLDLHDDPNHFTIFYDQVTGLQYIRNSHEVYSQGLYIELDAYKYHVFLDFYEIQDNDWRQFAQLAAYLNGRGVPSIDEALREFFLQPIHSAFRELVNPGSFHWLIDNRSILSKGKVSNPATQPLALAEAERKVHALLVEVQNNAGTASNLTSLTAEISAELASALTLPAVEVDHPLPKSRAYTSAMRFLREGPVDRRTLASGEAGTWCTLLGWLFIYKLGKVVLSEEISKTAYQELSRTWIDEWLLGKILAGAMVDMGMTELQAQHNIQLIKILTNHADIDLPPSRGMLYQSMQNWLKDADIQSFLGVNRYQDILWFKKEAFEELLWWMFAVQVMHACIRETESQQGPQVILAAYEVVRALQIAKEKSNYQVEKLLEGLI
jgi:hypothetical protein